MNTCNYMQLGAICALVEGEATSTQYDVRN